MKTAPTKMKSSQGRDRTHKALGGLSRKEIDEILSLVSGKDKKLKGVIERVKNGFTFEIEETESPFGAIAEAIVYQQLTGKAAATIYGRLKNLFDTDTCPPPENIIAAPDTVLRSAGLSRAKVLAIKDLSRKFIDGKIPTLDEVQDMSDDEIVTTLSSVRGVGVWTAQMFLIFRLGRADVMPSSDYGVRKGFAITYGDGETLPAPKEIEKHAERWRPYRTVGSWYMWRAVELHRQGAKNEDEKQSRVESRAKAL